MYTSYVERGLCLRLWYGLSATPTNPPALSRRKLAGLSQGLLSAALKGSRMKDPLGVDASSEGDDDKDAEALQHILP